MSKLNKEKLTTHGCKSLGAVVDGVKKVIERFFVLQIQIFLCMVKTRKSLTTSLQ